ncbi:MAG TPA: ATP-binding protein [Ktedonobacteraceae bacterium]|nr:ATP-binding protein [Ktedonobacteraceae bacterium]
MPLSEQERPPFVLRRNFILTPFEKRFQGILQNARQNRSWHIIAAVPGSGKSLGIHDFVRHSGAYKEADGRTFLPVLAIRAPGEGSTEQALGQALSDTFGVVPKMPWYARRTWLIQEMAGDQVECIIADDAQDFSRHHLAFLKKLTDDLAAPPYEHPVGLCLVVAHSGNVAPFKEVFSRPEILWRQFRRRLDTEQPICTVLGHTADEVRLVLTAFEDLYRSQLPDLQLRLWADSIFEWLTHPILDPDATGRVTMDHLTRLVTTSLRRTYEQGATNVTAATLQAVADLMILRRDEITIIDDVPPEEFPPEQGVG